MENEKHKNYCGTCGRAGTDLCTKCAPNYDGIPDGYAFFVNKTPTELRGEVLDLARICVCTDRKEQYGDAEDSFRCIADMWNAYLRPTFPEIDIKPFHVPVMLALFKAARDATSQVHKVDTFVDIAGYAACAAAMIWDNKGENE